jgi:hypothetical protein
MAHLQERRSGDERRQFNGTDRRTQRDRRGNSGKNLEFIERARFKAWVEKTEGNNNDELV